MATMAVLQKLVQRRSELRIERDTTYNPNPNIARIDVELGIVKTYMNFCRDSLKEMVSEDALSSHVNDGDIDIVALDGSVIVFED